MSTLTLNKVAICVLNIDTARGYFAMAMRESAEMSALTNWQKNP